MSSNEAPPVRLQVACMHLRHKMMYCDARQSSPGMVDDSSDTRVFFCVKSHDAIGPDAEPVGPKYCAPGRGCYCGG